MILYEEIDTQFPKLCCGFYISIIVLYSVHVVLIDECTNRCRIKLLISVPIYFDALTHCFLSQQGKLGTDRPFPRRC